MKAVVLLSGGLDSTVMATKYVRDKDTTAVYALGINYGQRHVKEIEAAQRVADALGIEYKLLDLSGALGPLLTYSGSSLTNPMIEVPEGHYTAENQALTVVPNRNMVLLSLAGMYAISIEAEVIAYAAHAGDRAIYRDCRPEFYAAMGRAFALCDERPPRFEAPFVEITKADIVRLGAELHAPMELTWSCYKGGDKHCGKCGTCVERREAFQLAGVVDPTEYE
jgi:7-cyano-7-deazaguanine synthase